MTFRHDEDRPIHECWCCPMEVRDLLAQCGNLVGAYERGEHDRVASKMADLKHTLAHRRPDVDAHFIAIRGETAEWPRDVPPGHQHAARGVGIAIGDRVEIVRDRTGSYGPLPLPGKPHRGEVVFDHKDGNHCDVAVDGVGLFKKVLIADLVNLQSGASPLGQLNE